MDPKQVIRSAVARVKHTSTRNGREALGVFSLEGTRAVERALRAGVKLEQVLIGSSTSERERRLAHELEQTGIPIQPLPDDALYELTQGREFGPMIGIAPLPPLRPVPATGTFVVAVDIADPGNVGGMVRTSLAAGADGFICQDSSDPWSPKAVRTSMGSIFKLPIYRISHLGELPPGTKIATSPDPDAIPLPDIQIDAPTAFLFMGSEAFGLSDTLMAAMDLRVRIPMIDGVDSYSVNVATGIALYQLLQQRPG